ncbi:mPR-like GPCR protein [Xylariomycetidae sp. FL0641]|nr:mPR-like GPCR protein [Xylariomycetidae sp. FL0641]
MVTSASAPSVEVESIESTSSRPGSDAGWSGPDDHRHTHDDHRRSLDEKREHSVISSSERTATATTKTSCPPSSVDPEVARKSSHHQRGNGGDDDGPGDAETEQPLITFEDLPTWYADNPFIKAGYRPVLRSTGACLHSIAHVHNETLNIWTHAVPAAALLLGEAYVLAFLARAYPHLEPAGFIVVAALLLAGGICFSVSAGYHTLLCHSKEVESLWLRFDLVGIVILILGSFVSGIYVEFWCEYGLRRIYWAMTGSLACVTVIIMLAPCFQGPRWRSFRLIAFVVTGFAGIAPIAHGIHMFGFAAMARQSGLPYYIAEGAIFLLSAVVYAVRFPECLSPGTFDIYGSSHQIFHVLVVIASIVHLVGVLRAVDYNYNYRVCSAG